MVFKLENVVTESYDHIVTQFKKLASDQDLWSKVLEMAMLTTMEGKPRLKDTAKIDTLQRVGYVMGILESLGARPEAALRTLFAHMMRASRMSASRVLPYFAALEYHDIQPVEPCPALQALCHHAVTNNRSSAVPLIIKKLDPTGELATMWGKMAPKGDALNAPLFQERIRTWLLEAKEPPGADALLDRVTRVGNRFPRDPPKQVKWADFLAAKNLWATSGALSEKSGDLKNKLQLAFTYTPAEVLERVDRAVLEGKHEYSVSMKHEPATVRLIIVESFEDYLLKAYISYHLDQVLGAVEGMFNWYSASRKMKYWRSVAFKVAKGWFAVNTDFKGWDEQVFQRAKLRMVDMILSWFARLDPAFVNKYGDYIRMSLQRIFGGEMANGLPSGTRWTTLINSWLNIALAEMAYFMATGREAGEDDIAVLGDDQNVMVQVKVDGQRYLDAVDLIGFKLSPDKVRLTQDPEFLRMTLRASGAYDNPLLNRVWSGSALRQLRALIWSNSEAETLLQFDARLRERVDNWAKLLSRTLFDPVLDKEKVMAFIVEDVAIMARIPSRDDAAEVLNTPIVLGGLGLGIAGTMALDVSQTPPSVSRVSEERIARANNLADSTLAGYMFAVAFGTLRAPTLTMQTKRVRDPPQLDTAYSGISVTKKGMSVPAIDYTLGADSFLSNQWISIASKEQLARLIDQASSPLEDGASQLPWTADRSAVLKAQARYYASLLPNWSKTVALEEWKNHTATAPPTDPSSVLRWGEVYGPLIHQVGWSSFMLPRVFRKLDLGQLKKLRYNWAWAMAHSAFITWFGDLSIPAGGSLPYPL